MPSVGETISEGFETGAIWETFTVYQSLIDGQVSSWVPEFSEIGGGFYSYTYTPLIPGFYVWTGNGSTSGPLTINFEVNPTEEVVPPVPPSGLGVGPVSLDALVEHVAARSMDLVQGHATQDESGFQTFTDVNALIEDHAFYAGMEIHFTSGLNSGLTRRIADSDYSTGTLSWEQPVLVQIQTGDTVNLYNRSGLGHLYQEYKNALNMAIREVGTNVMRRVDLTVSGMPSYGTPAITLNPTQIAKVCRFSYLDFSGARVSVRRNRRNGWWADNGGDSVSFNGAALSVVAQSTPPLIAHGYARSTELHAGTDTTFIDAEWLVDTTAGMLQNANPDNAGNLAPGQYLRNRADSMRGKMATPFDANCVSIA